MASDRQRLLFRLRLGLLIALGLVLGEIASMWAFAGPIDAILANRAALTPTVVAAHSRLDSALGDRARLDAGVAAAQKSLDDAVIRANCEVNPKPGCPTNGQVTGVAGDGAETSAARSNRDRATRNLDAAIADRTQRTPALDAQVSSARDNLASAQAQIPAVSTGVGARWVGLNAYTFAHRSAVLLRALLAAIFVGLCVAPLLFWRLRGESAAKRLARAEAEATAEIAIKQAEIRAETEKLKAEQELEKAKIEAEAELFLEQERQRLRVAAELGMTVKPRELGDGQSSELALPATESSWLPSPLQGIAALANSVISAPARAAQAVVEEFEELTFTITRKRKITVREADEADFVAIDGPIVVDAGVVGAGVVDAEVIELESASPRALPRGL